MPPTKYIRPTHSRPPPIPPLLQPQPPIAPLIPPVHVIDLMTDAGSAAFGAVWRAEEAKPVEANFPPMNKRIEVPDVLRVTTDLTMRMDDEVRTKGDETSVHGCCTHAVPLL